MFLPSEMPFTDTPVIRFDFKYYFLNIIDRKKNSNRPSKTIAELIYLGNFERERLFFRKRVLWINKQRWNRLFLEWSSLVTDWVNNQLHLSDHMKWNIPRYHGDRKTNHRQIWTENTVLSFQVKQSTVHRNMESKVFDSISVHWVE